MHRMRLWVMGCGFCLLAGMLPAWSWAAEGAKTSLDLPHGTEGVPGVGPLRQQQWMFDTWHRRRTAFAAHAHRQQGAVVFVGASITQGWGENFGGAFAGLKTANRGISGDTTRGMLLRLPEDVFALHPRAVVFLGGTNDIDEKATPEEIASNFKDIVAACKKRDPLMPIIVCAIMPSSPRQRRPAATIKRVNELFAEASKGDPQVTWVDTWTIFANENGDAKKNEFPDLLHPNDVGYKKWAAALQPVLWNLADHIGKKAG